MPQGERRCVQEANLRLGVTVAEIEGLYSAILRTARPRRRQELCADLARAARRLAAAADLPPGQQLPAAAIPRSRRQRRRALAERGAAWIMARYGGE